MEQLPGLHPIRVQDYVSEAMIEAVVAQRAIKTAEEIEQLEAVRPGIEFRGVHQLVCTVLACGLRDLGLMRGDVDEAVLGKPVPTAVTEVEATCWRP